MADQPRKDHKTNTYTTGHKWDHNLEELDNDIPRWWLLTFFLCIAVALLYVVLYPSFPTHKSFFTGLLGYDSADEFAKQQEDIAQANATKNQQLQQLAFADIIADKALYTYAVRGGEALFQENCAPCHGQNGMGREGGYPVLADDDWIWGGSLKQIEQTITYGVRINEKGRQSMMPAFGRDELLTPEEIRQVTYYVRNITMEVKEATPEQLALGEKIYAQNCASCHSADGIHAGGGKAFGAPALNDAIWLYGNNQQAVYNQIYNPKLGAMPSWIDRLNAEKVKMLTLYVYQLSNIVQ